MDDFEQSCKGLYRALTIREKYMRLSYQRYPRTTSEYLREIEGESFKIEDQVQPGEERSSSREMISVLLGYPGGIHSRLRPSISLHSASGERGRPL